MSFGRLDRTPGSQPMSDINMTPLIDVMLVLVVIFIITAPVSYTHLDVYKRQALRPVFLSSSILVMQVFRLPGLSRPRIRG